MEIPTLFIFSGLPASGKTTLARHLAADRGAVYLRVDTIEQGIRDLCEFQVEGEGYRLAYRVAADNLRLGLSVVADSCNPIELTRREWEAVAQSENANFVNVEVVCSDTLEHRRRVESRTSAVPNMKLPTWDEVISREYHPWSVPRVTIDTEGKSVEASCRELSALMKR
ncbi:MAG: AAA family ATPase [Pseudomonadota bacterium]